MKEKKQILWGEDKYHITLKLLWISANLIQKQNQSEK